MSFQPRIEGAEVVIVLGGIDEVLCWRREVRVDLDAATSSRREDREVLGSRLDSRV